MNICRYLLILMVFMAAPACAQNEPITVVASFSILGDMVAQIGGDAVHVKALVGPNSDTHSYQPAPDDVRTLAKADIVFMNGLGLERWMMRLIEASATKATIITATTSITPRSIIEGKNQRVTDPHAWQNLANAHIYIKNILDALIKAAPAHAEAFKKRAAHFDAQVTEMDQYIREQIDAIPAKKRVIITSHDTFGYFGDAYHITFKAPEGLSKDAQPSAATITKLIDQIKAEHVKQVFIETVTDSRLIKQIGKDSGATMGGALYSDALSDAKGTAPHYLDMFRNNVPKLVDAMKANGS